MLVTAPPIAAAKDEQHRTQVEPHVTQPPLSRATAPHAPLTPGSLTVNPNLQEIFYNGRKIDLRKKEYQLLEFLIQNRDRVVNRLTILEYVWNYEAQIDTNTLEVHMAALRRKIEKFCARQMIETVYGMGYRLSMAE